MERERERFAVDEMMYVMSRKNPWSKPPFVKKWIGVVMIWKKVKRLQLRGEELKRLKS